MTAAYPEPGAQLGPFRLGNQLGVGGMGVVFEALDTELRRQVALKVIAPHLAQDEEFRARFTREAQAQASLDSPHVVSVYSFGETDGHLYLASQLIPDGDLATMLRHHGVPPVRVALHLVAQVADGLADAHQAGLVHRDIKPENVLLRHRDAALTAYLGDFGIARRMGEDHRLTQAGSAPGTPSFMAPELHRGEQATPSSDVYAVGCLLWTTLTGAAPYPGSSEYEIAAGHVEGAVSQLEPSGPLAVEVNRVLRLALAKQPHERYPSAAALRDDARRLLTLPDDAVALRPRGAEPDTVERQRWPGGTPAAVAARAEGGDASGPSTGHRPPLAPTFHPGAPVPPHQQGDPLPPAVRRRRIGAVIVVAALVVVTAIVVAVVLTIRGSGDDGGAGGFGGSNSSDISDQAREDEAVANLTTSLGETFGTEFGGCIAQHLVDDVGVDGLVEQGLLTDDLAFVADKQIPGSGLETPLNEATSACIGTLVPGEGSS